jgi:hypothetical protein
MNLKYIISETSYNLIQELKEYDNWEVFGCVLSHKNKKHLHLWIGSQWIFLDICTLAGEFLHAIPFKDRLIVWHYVKKIKKHNHNIVLRKIFEDD